MRESHPTKIRIEAETKIETEIEKAETTEIVEEDQVGRIQMIDTEKKVEIVKEIEAEKETVKKQGSNLTVKRGFYHSIIGQYNNINKFEDRNQDLDQ